MGGRWRRGTVEGNKKAKGVGEEDVKFAIVCCSDEERKRERIDPVPATAPPRMEN